MGGAGVAGVNWVWRLEWFDGCGDAGSGGGEQQPRRNAAYLEFFIQHLVGILELPAKLPGVVGSVFFITVGVGGVLPL
ncbi:unnamed protein product [Prunus armeniaca]|uniref:Uncharacterized protein n=1 Tax=Prunus armeniaca TaxID=36596 RepID=A0A6J5XQJ8_PRUAR|nr:unnamed protein product [Prunus armeniaca]